MDKANQKTSLETSHAKTVSQLLQKSALWEAAYREQWKIRATLATELLKISWVILHFSTIPVLLFYPSTRTLLSKAKVTLVAKGALGGGYQALTSVPGH